jgi:hypothetical protein
MGLFEESDISQVLQTLLKRRSQDFATAYLEVV